MNNNNNKLALAPAMPHCTIPANFTSLNISLRSSGSSISAAHLRSSSYYNPNFAAAAQQLRMRSEWERNIVLNEQDQQRRVLFPIATSLEDQNVNAILQLAKQESREGTNNNVDMESTGGRKRQLATETTEVSHHHHQMGSYLIQSSAGSIQATHSPVPAPFYMVTNNPSSSNHNNQVINGDPMWAFGNSTTSNMYRGSSHFMNFATPMTLLSGQQLGTGGGGVSDSHLGMLAALNAYRPIPIGGGGGPESPTSRSDPHQGGEDGHGHNASS
ncbi:hypothetical protein ACFE04_024956 [Oxalis oulophora]